MPHVHLRATRHSTDGQVTLRGIAVAADTQVPLAILVPSSLEKKSMRWWYSRPRSARTARLPDRGMIPSRGGLKSSSFPRSNRW
jgi:hypothetical protein